MLASYRRAVHTIAAPTTRSSPDLDSQHGVSFIEAWKRRREREDIGKERQVKDEIREDNPPDGVYLVVGGERILIDD